MKILITGGAGFLGINLVRYLLNKGNDIVSLDIAEFDRLLEPRAGPKQPRLDRADAAAEHLGDIAKRHLLVAAHVQDEPVFQRKPMHRREDNLPYLLGDHISQGILGAVRRHRIVLRP